MACFTSLFNKFIKSASANNTVAVLCVGINKFKYMSENNLQGCVNDAKDMAAFFNKNLKADITILTDKQATKNNVITNLKNIINSEKYKKLYFTFSSHGSQINDTNMDEKDFVDECFVCYDTKPDLNNVIVDDEFYTLFEQASQKISIEVFLDTCHSGTGLKKLGRDYRVARFIFNKNLKKGTERSAAKKNTLLKANKNIILWAGCKSNEYSSDAFIDGKYNGAFTRYFLNYFNKTYNRSRHLNLFKAGLVNDYDQTPQLECDTTNKNAKMI